jgi:catechol 2,3-dioxygenase-like lactoylglutathione lyase family enzyme
VSQQQESQFTLPPVYQLGYVVNDIERACKYYESVFGTGPFSQVIDVNMDGALLRGKPVDTTIKVAFVQSGDVQIELIQPVAGENLYTEFLEERGEGIHHLAYQVEDLEAMKAVFTEKVGEPVFCRDMGVMEFAYFDTSEVGGLMIEFLCFKKDVLGGDNHA